MTHKKLFPSLVRAAFAVLAATLLAASGAQAQDTRGCALVVMHGKWANAQYLKFFARKMEPTCAWESIELPWAQRRGYDATYPQALADIGKQVKAFRDQGYKRVVLVGHSFGANAAFAYMAEVGDADAIVSLAAGHSPKAMYERNIGREAVDKARALVAAGKGDETLGMDDLNQGQRRTVRMRADVLLSYFDPEGLGDMPTSASRAKKPVPVLWVIGNADPLFRAGRAYVFDKLPPNPASQYLEVQATHESTPDVAAAQVLEWLKALP